jgi:hypothetical protein
MKRHHVLGCLAGWLLWGVLIAIDYAYSASISDIPKAIRPVTDPVVTVIGLAAWPFAWGLWWLSGERYSERAAKHNDWLGTLGNAWRTCCKMAAQANAITSGLICEGLPPRLRCQLGQLPPRFLDGAAGREATARRLLCQSLSRLRRPCSRPLGTRGGVARQSPLGPRSVTGG